ncbi:MAG: hypothetical protein H0V29_05760 [Thermoleophilaceae bacterium]|nr:hypothetical protein [Thermoleophilaceae bacterium]
MAFGLVSATAPPAVAEDDNVITPQAEIANMSFLPWAPLPSSIGAVCLVDSGVDETPDTGAVVSRSALDGGPGTDFSPIKHGTIMTQRMAGPVNGWGSVGVWPVGPDCVGAGERGRGAGF